MDGTVVAAPCGKLRGSCEKTSDDFEFYSFKGIPYAKPPSGDLRFKDPVPLEPWTDIREAKKFGPICAQFDMISRSFQGGDDCLYLNVYTKSITGRVPVMFWIHGGGFMHGNGETAVHGPDHLIKKDVVLVTLNYRLGVFGFLNLEDEIATGNQGLKDQVMALTWVRDNIASFGGDPENVTIFGGSAGGASVHYLCISPLAKGLFHKAISQSGVALNTWATMPEDPRRKAYHLCALLGNRTKDHGEIINFLRSVDCQKIVEAQEKILTAEEKYQFIFPFGPGVDDKSERPFLNVPVDIAAQEGVHVPYLLGYNSREGIFLHSYFKEDVLEKLDNDMEKYIHPKTKEMLQNLNLTVKDFKRLYYGSENITKENNDKHADLLGDEHFVIGIHKVVKIQVEKSSASTYLYQFSFDQGMSLARTIVQTNLKGVTHADEILYLFKPHLLDTLNIDPLPVGTIQHKVMEQMVELWTNFAKTGRPTTSLTNLTPVYWQPVNDATVLRLLNISEEPQMEKVLNLEEKLSFKRNYPNKL